jgi:hypothetical protein
MPQELTAADVAHCEGACRTTQSASYEACVCAGPAHRRHRRRVQQRPAPGHVEEGRARLMKPWHWRSHCLRIGLSGANSSPRFVRARVKPVQRSGRISWIIWSLLRPDLPAEDFVSCIGRTNFRTWHRSGGQLGIRPEVAGRCGPEPLTACRLIHGHRSWLAEVQTAGPLPHSALGQPVLCDHVEIAQPAVERG